MWVSNCGRVKSCGIVYRPKPNSAKRAYVVVGDRTIPIYRLVMVLFNDPALALWTPNLTVDHKDRNPENNNTDNLRWATKTEQALNRTHYGSTLAFCCGVFARKVGTENWIRYASQKEAELDLAISYGNVCKALQKNTAVCKGYEFKLDDALLDGEEWRTSTRGSVDISSCGRIRFHGKAPRFASAHVSGYHFATIGGSKIGIHTLVLESFGSDRPSLEHTPDHRDGNKSNNTISNLQWATASQQRQNQRRSADRINMPEIKARRVGSSQWYRFDSIAHVAKVTGCKKDHISKVCLSHSRMKSAGCKHGRFEFQYIIEPDIEGEVWKSIVVEDWVEGGCYESV